MHTATATNWNGKTLSLTFKAATSDLAKLAKKARAAFERKGFTTIRLDKVDELSVPYELAY